MIKEELNKMCKAYQRVLNMSEAEVFAMYEESKEECIASFEAEIDHLEETIYGHEENEDITYGLDPAFSSWYEVNSMFV